MGETAELLTFIQWSPEDKKLDILKLFTPNLLREKLTEAEQVTELFNQVPADQHNELMIHLLSQTDSLDAGKEWLKKIESSQSNKMPDEPGRKIRTIQQLTKLWDFDKDFVTKAVRHAIALNSDVRAEAKSNNSYRHIKDQLLGRSKDVSYAKKQNSKQDDIAETQTAKPVMDKSKQESPLFIKSTRQSSFSQSTTVSSQYESLRQKSKAHHSREDSQSEATHSIDEAVVATRGRRHQR
jgi:hypothetical protein